MAESSQPNEVNLDTAHLRVSPKNYLNYTKSPEKSDKLLTEEVENKCFSALGYLEELYLKPKEFNKDSEESRKDKINNKLKEIFSYPQVKEKFTNEFNDEIEYFLQAGLPMAQIRKINQERTELSTNIYTTYLNYKENYGKLPQSGQEEIAEMQAKISKLQEQKRGIENTASPSTFGYLKTQKLLTYKLQLKEKGFALTPSREDLIDRIKKEALSGKKIFLVGSTVTGKTQLGIYALNELRGYEIIPWHEGTTPRDIFGYRELYEDKEGKVQSGVKQGPYPTVLEQKHGLLHEEYTGGSTRTQLSMKYLLGARPGDEVKIPGFNGKVFEISPNFLEIFTGNPKDEKTKQREEMDPAILRELTGVEVEYMPAKEMADIIKAQLIEENGVLKLSRPEIEYVERLANVAEVMQKVHNREFSNLSDEMKSLLGIDSQNNTENTLNTNFLDPGTLFKLFNNWELEKARGKSFKNYITEELDKFIKDPKTLGHLEERQTLSKILSAFNLDSIPEVVGKQEKHYTLPSEMAGIKTQSDTNPINTDETSPIIKTSEKIFCKKEKKEWVDKLGGYPDVLPLPASLTPEVLRKSKEMGLEPRFISLDIGTLVDLQNMGVETYLKMLHSSYPDWNPYEKLLEKYAKAKISDDLSETRNLRKWYWEEVKKGNIEFPKLPGKWVLVETMRKPNSDEKYDPSKITDMLGIGDRFGKTWNDIDKAIKTNGGKVLDKLGIKGELRMLNPLEYNLMANREGWGKTNTWEWTNTKYSDGTVSLRVIVGHSGRGGAAGASWYDPEVSYGYVGVRFLVVIN